MKGPSILADVNVWLASIVERHPHHRVVKGWWASEVVPSGSGVAFCRPTQLGLLRLLSDENVMGPQRRTPQQAYEDYRQIVDQEPVFFAAEPEGLEPLLRDFCQLEGASRNFWTDAYLAAFARAAGMRLTTLDRGFQRFPKLQLQLLG